MKKSILIFAHGMEIGGVEKALLGLLETIDEKKYNIDLFLMRHSGELLRFIPKKINILSEIPQYACMAVPIKQVLNNRQIGVLIGRAIGKELAYSRVRELKLNDQNDVSLEYSHKYVLPFMPMISNKTYDLAISFLTPHYFVAKKVKAKKKIAWIHTDYSMVDVDKSSQMSMWDSYDFIASISNACTDSFLSVFPYLESKIRMIENIIPIKMIYEQSYAFNTVEEMPDDGYIKLLTIGRFSNAKNMDNIPAICALINNVIKVKWYIIGYGNEEKLIRSKIQETNMEQYVIILGKKENPYPYIRACDLYVQPSRYEGNCISVHEAQALHKPVVITRYPTSASQLQDGIDGLIVSMDNDGCAKGITSILMNDSIREKIIRGTYKKDYSNATEIEKLEKLVD